MPDTIEGRLGLSDRTVQRIVKARTEDAERGIVFFRAPNVSAPTVGGDTVTVRLMIEDGAGGRRHRVKIVWTLASEGHDVLHSQGASIWKYVQGHALADLTRRQQALALLYLAGIEVA